MNKRSMWQKTPWLVRAFGISLLFVVVLLVIVKVANALGASKPLAENMPDETPLEQTN